VKVDFSRGSYKRGPGDAGYLALKNRFFQENPVLTENGAEMLSRPGQRRFLEVGGGPIRGLYDQSGSFDDALFIVSEDGLYRLDKDLTLTFVGTITGYASQSSVSMAATSTLGTTPAYLFIADGAILWVYTDDGFATGILSGSAIANNDTVNVGGIYYLWTNASVDASAPAGTLANPWRVNLGANMAASISNLYAAINETGTAGVTYSTALTEHPTVSGNLFTSTDLTVNAKTAGALGNGIVTTETGANIAWAAATLTGGGSPTLLQVPTPDDIGAIRVGYIGNYVIVIPAQGFGINGRFWWIEPGEITIDPLNFATAERAPDPINDIVVFGDQFWLCGDTDTEVWYMSGEADIPVLRMQGVAFDRGVWSGTALQVKESMIAVTQDGTVFRVKGGFEEISNPKIAKRIRTAIQNQALAGL
jgi:hypothetical protein